MKKVASK